MRNLILVALFAVAACSTGPPGETTSNALQTVDRIALQNAMATSFLETEYRIGRTDTGPIGPVATCAACAWWPLSSSRDLLRHEADHFEFVEGFGRQQQFLLPARFGIGTLCARS
ncbi:hypothetical protein [Brevundimonas sp. TWP2-3-4b2]|uniref:hypothetical protein n=1 Tax=Brevundimonas sp. TWP2-3-4b2 TaxID=2804595 RepID=UPI003CEDDC1C